MTNREEFRRYLTKTKDGAELLDELVTGVQEWEAAEIAEDFGVSVRQLHSTVNELIAEGY